MKRFLSIFRVLLISCLVMLITATSVWQPVERVDQVRSYTRNFEFDYFGWTLKAFWVKFSSASLGPAAYLTQIHQRKLLKDYFEALSEIQPLEESLEMLFADPLSDFEPDDRITIEAELDRKRSNLGKLAALAESVLQDQISQSLGELGLTKLNQPIPPVLYHSSDLPKNLVISPRDVIRQERSISLSADIALSDEVAIETAVEENTEYSALVVPVGGVGTYPTMVIQSSNLPSLLETIAHEWAHNYLSLRPLGMRYSVNSALRTMNETAANIAGEEISQHVLRQFYWDLIQNEEEKPYQTFETGFPFSPARDDNLFDFRKEMYETRRKVDELLKQGKIEEAESFMEARRQVFWENGYSIRKLNQAYFAFYGAYADKPFSAAGADPVGSDVRLLRARSTSLAEFIEAISQMRSYQELKDFLHSY
jgi:hypothetical protein